MERLIKISGQLEQRLESLVDEFIPVKVLVDKKFIEANLKDLKRYCITRHIDYKHEGELTLSLELRKNQVYHLAEKDYIIGMVLNQ